jgi:hypothetical protein
LDDGGVDQTNSTSSVRFAVTALAGEPDDVTVDVALADLGFSGEVHVRDLWSRSDIGIVEGVLSTSLGPHESALYLLSDALAPTADFNHDGAVDGADYLIWQRGVGLASNADPSQGDADGDGDVDADDLQAWRTQFTAGFGAVVRVPEFPSGALAALGVAMLRTAPTCRSFFLSRRLATPRFARSSDLTSMLDLPCHERCSP